MRVTLTESQGELLDRAREVLSHSGRMPSLPEILVKALEDLLDKRDPLRKAERAKARAENSPSSEKEASAEVETETEAVSALASPGNGDQSPTKKSPSRPAIPAVTRHAVWLRDRGQCTWRHPGGSRCRTGTRHRFHGTGAQARSWGGQPGHLNRWRWHKKSADRGSREISPKEFQRLVETSNGTILLIS